MPVEYKMDTDSVELSVFVSEEPTYVFEYYETACQLANDVGGEPASIFLTKRYNVQSADHNNSRFIGYGVLKNKKVI